MRSHQRARAERALEASRARYENLYQDAPDMFASVSVGSECIVQCNQTLVRATGFTRQELLGLPVRQLHHPLCRPDLREAFQSLGETGRVDDVELQLRRKDGSVIDVSLSVAAIRDERGHLYYRSTWRDITERKRAALILREQQVQLERSQADLQALAGRLLTAQEDERRRLSRELHDDLNQRVALLTVGIEALQQDLPRSRQAIAQRLQSLRQEAVALSDAVHTLAYQLHASVLDDLGLAAALRSFVDDFAQRHGIGIELHQEELSEPIPSDVASCLYRVAQEALRNVARHARAQSARVQLRRSARGLKMTVVDPGVGFDLPPTADLHHGLGIVGMQERVRLVGGRFELTSSPGSGTRIDVWVPTTGDDA